MNDARAMSTVERGRDLNRDIERLVHRHRSTRETRRQRLAVQAFHDEKIEAVLVPDVVQGADVRMAQRGDRAGLAFEALTRRAASSTRRSQHLDGHRAIEPGIAARVHVTHAAGAEQGLDLVDAQARARRQRWCILRVREISGEGIEDFFSRTLAKASGLLMGREKRRDSGQQRLIVTAQSARVREPLLRRPLECLLEYVLHAGPRRRERHGGPDSRPAVIRRYSHARAACHSRVTVAREIDSTSATSCSVRPAKYRSSMMVARRWSNVVSSSSA